MIKNTVLLLGFLFGNFVYCQDLIITQSSDSIKCKITKVRKENLYFIHKKNNRYQSSLIEKSKVTKYVFDFYPDDRIPKDSVPGYEEFPRHIIGINGGYSYDPGRVQSGLLLGFEEYTNDLRSGLHFEANYIYYYQKKFGFGLRVNFYSTNALQNNVNGRDNLGNPVTATLSNDISVFFIGPSSAIRFLSKNQKNAFTIKSSIGYTAYKDTYEYVTPIITTANGVGVVSSLGYDFGLSEKLSLGFQIGGTTLLSKKIEIDDGSTIFSTKLSNGERLIGGARLDFSVGLRYHL